MAQPQCPYCYNRMCKKHPLQDHGASLAARGPADRSRALNDLFQKTVGS